MSDPSFKLQSTLKRWQMRAVGVGLIAVSFALAVAGCVTKLPYPRDWGPVVEVERGQYPRIEGRYQNTGISGNHHCSSHGSVYTWDCDIDLSSNILSGRPSELDRGRASRWVELKQPDDNTLVIELDDGKPPIVLKRDKEDFALGSDGLTVSQSGSGMRFKDTEKSDTEVVGATIAGAVLLTGSVDTVSRTFSRLKDGSLLMKVHESRAGGILGIPMYLGTVQYVRWLVIPSENGGKPPSE
jgi:hypothetical protein